MLRIIKSSYFIEALLFSLNCKFFNLLTILFLFVRTAKVPPTIIALVVNTMLPNMAVFSNFIIYLFVKILEFYFFLYFSIIKFIKGH